MARRSSRQSQDMGQSSPSLDLDCEPIAPSVESVASKPKFVDSRSLLFEEHHKTPAGDLTLTFDCLARVYVTITLTRFGTSSSSTETGQWNDRSELMPCLREIGAVPAGWERIYGSGPDHQV